MRAFNGMHLLLKLEVTFQKYEALTLELLCKRQEDP